MYVNKVLGTLLDRTMIDYGTNYTKLTKSYIQLT